MSKRKYTDWKREIAPRAPADPWAVFGRDFFEMWNEAEDIRQEMEYERQAETLGNESARLPRPGRRHLYGPSGGTTAASAKAAGGNTQ